MDILSCLKEYRTEKKELQFRTEKYDYVKADYFNNNTLIWEFFVFDYTVVIENNAKWDIFQYDRYFNEFQNQILEDVFFEQKGDLKYNLYLIFIMNDSSRVEDKFRILSDFRFARKLFLSEEEFADYFKNMMSLRRTPNTDYPQILAEPSKRQFEIDRHKKKVLDYLYPVLIDYSNITRKKKGKASANEIQKLVSFYMNMKDMGVHCEKGDREYEKKRAVLKRPNKKNTYNIQSIASISMEQFRCYRKNCKLTFGKVNLFYGDNGVGKTSVLDAIELAITGTSRKKDYGENNKSDISIECRTSDENVVAMKRGSDYRYLSERWYGSFPDSLEEFDNLFTRYNYFDTGWASAFAVKGQEKNMIALLKNFLCIKDISDTEEVLEKIYEELMRIMQSGLVEVKKRNKKASPLRIRKTDSKNKIEEQMQIMFSNCQKDYKSFIQEKEELDSSLKGLGQYVTTIEKVFKLLINYQEYEFRKSEDGKDINVIRYQSKEQVSLSKMSTGQKVCLALSFMFALFISNKDSPNFIMLDEPVVNLDDLHMLNMLDVLKRLSLAGTQIFFTTANPDVAKLFRRKFSFLGKEFRAFKIQESGTNVKIEMNIYDSKMEQPLESSWVYS